jgi:cytoskeletal protein CcmA (bactofilin family)
MEYTSFSRLHRSLTIGVAAVIVLGLLPSPAHASSWSPTLLVNTESFNVIDDGDGSTDIELRFGDSVDERLRWDVANSRFQFTDDVHVEGNITGSGTLTVDGDVKTKANLTINSDSGGADAVLTFGNDAADETITFSDSSNNFEVSDDIDVTGTVNTTGNITTDANLTINEDNGGADAVLTFGNDAGVETITFSDTSNAFEVSDDFTVNGTLSGSAFHGAGLTDCDQPTDKLTWDQATGQFICTTESVAGGGSVLIQVGDSTVVETGSTMDFAAADFVVTEAPANEANISLSVDGLYQKLKDFFVEDTGDTMTGSLTISNGGTLAASGSIRTEGDLTINEDNSAVDAVLTFGSDGTAETITFANTADRFEFSEDVRVTGNTSVSGNVTASGNLAIDGTALISGAATFGSTVSLNGVTYTFPYSDGTASGKVLKTDGAGNLVWTDDTDTSNADQNLFETFAISGQNNVVADSTTDTLTLAEGSNITITTNDSTDTITIASTDNNTTYTAGQGIGLNGTTFSLNSTITGSLANFTTVSGAIVHARDLLRSSGGLLVGGASTLQAVTATTVDTTGNITTDANLTINEDSGAADAVLTFGNASGDKAITFSNGNQRFEFADDIYTAQTLTVDSGVTFGSTMTIGGVTYTFPTSDGSSSGKVLKTDSSGQLAWSDDIDTNTQNTYEAGEGIQLAGSVFSLTDAISGSTLDTTGNITTDANLTINEDNGGADAVLTFGNDAGAETITFSDTTNRFEISDDVYATGVVRAAGGLSGSSLTVDGGSVTINGVAYSFTNSDGNENEVLTTDGAGNLTWSGLQSGSGNTVFLQPEYPHAIYFASGSTANVGQLYGSGGTAMENNYTWTSSKAAIQDYWISTKVKIPHNFSGWSPTPIQFRYKTGTAVAAQNHVSVKFLDTAGTEVDLTGGGGLASTSWSTANVTGPESTGTYTADSYITVMVKLAATSTSQAQANAGYINLNWITTTP